MPRSFLTKGLAALDRSFRRTAARSIDGADRDLAAATAQNAPVQTGQMASSIVVLAARASDRQVAGAVVIGDLAAVHVEYGTDDQDAQPFFRPAIAARKGSMRRGLLAQLKNL